MSSRPGPDEPPPGLARIARSEWRQFDPARILRTSKPVAYWTGRCFAPAEATAWCKHYGQWYVRLRTRRDIWRDREDWYSYVPGRIIPLDLDERDRRQWLPKR